MNKELMENDKSLQLEDVYIGSALYFFFLKPMT